MLPRCPAARPRRGRRPGSRCRSRPVAKLAGQQVLPAVADGQRARAGPPGRRSSPGAQHVAHLLGVGAQPQVADADVGVQHVAALDDRVARRRRTASSGAHAVLGPLHVDVGLEPDRQVEVGEALADVPGDVVGRGHAGRDHLAREGLGDHAAGQRDDVRDRPPARAAVRVSSQRTHQLLGADQPRRERRAQGLAQPVAREPRSGRRPTGPVAAGVDADAPRIALAR